VELCKGNSSGSEEEISPVKSEYKGDGVELSNKTTKVGSSKRKALVADWKSRASNIQAAIKKGGK
jgi:hypothetical protein